MMKYQCVEGSLICKAHALISDVVTDGDTVVDATVGNGHDTLFLAGCVGRTGRVIGFDVQERAINSTREKLSDAGIDRDVYQLHLAGHESMGELVPDGISVAMFNLGYLPGSDKTTITQVSTTLKALEAALCLIKAGGVVSVMCYPGHDGGGTEADAVEKWTANLDAEACSHTVFRRSGASETSPFLIFIRKRKRPVPQED